MYLDVLLQNIGAAEATGSHLLSRNKGKSQTICLAYTLILGREVISGQDWFARTAIIYFEDEKDFLPSEPEGETTNWPPGALLIDDA